MEAMETWFTSRKKVRWLVSQSSRNCRLIKKMAREVLLKLHPDKFRHLYRRCPAKMSTMIAMKINAIVELKGCRASSN